MRRVLEREIDGGVGGWEKEGDWKRERKGYRERGGVKQMFKNCNLQWLWTPSALESTIVHNPLQKVSSYPWKKNPAYKCNESIQKIFWYKLQFYKQVISADLQCDCMRIVGGFGRSWSMPSLTLSFVCQNVHSFSLQSFTRCWNKKKGLEGVVGE